MPQIAYPVASWVGSAIGSAVGTISFAAGATGLAGVSAAMGAAGLFTSVGVMAIDVAFWMGLSYAVDAATKPKLKPPGSELQFNMDPAYPREMIIGQRLVGGSMVARYSRGSNLYNAHMVIQVADHPCVELSKVYDAGRVVRDTPLTHGSRTEITAYSNSGGARVWMTWWDGRPGQTADTDLITKSAQDPDVVAGKLPGWSSDHVGAGCAYIHVEVQWDSDILTSIPQLTWLVKGARLYDRRLDTTAGGSGSHRLDDPSTWEYTDNAAVAADHYLLGYKVEDDDLAFGIGLHPSEVPYAIFANAADLADEDVETGTGDDVETIKRYVVNGVVSAAEYFEDVLEAFQMQMAGRFVDLGGRIGFLGAEEREISLDLSDQDLTSDDQMQFADKLSFDDLYGSVSGTFADPANLYQQTPYETQYTPYNALPDGGEAQQVQLALPYEIHPRRAVRNVSAWLNRESLQPRLVGVFMAVAWALEPGDWFTFSSERLQLTSAKFEVIDIAKNDDFTVMITARAIDPEFLAFSVDNDPDLSVPPEVEPASLFLDEPEFDVEVSTLVAGGVVEPCLEFTLTSDETVAREIVVEYGKWDGSDIEGPTLVDSIHVSQVVTKLRKGVLPSTSYKVRAKAKAGLRESDWSDWSSVITTGATYAVGSAASVPWTGVTDPSGTRPDDNADVTSANTAAAITGQGWGATQNLLSLRQSVAGIRPAIGADFSGATSTSETTPEATSELTSGTVVSVANEGDVRQFTGNNSVIQRGWEPVVTGRTYRLTSRNRITVDGTSNILVMAFHVYNASGTYLGSQGLATIDSSFVAADGWRTDSINATAAAILAAYPTAAFVRGRVQGARTAGNSHSGATWQCAWSRLERLQILADGSILREDGSTALTDSLIVTTLGTAAAIASQGGLATLNFTTLGSNVRLENGTTVATNALLQTSLGTAAGITSQGAFATMSQITAATYLAAGVVSPSRLVIGDQSNLWVDDFADANFWNSVGGTWTVSSSGDNTERNAMGAANVMKAPAGNGTTSQASASSTATSTAYYSRIEPGRPYRFFMRTLVQAGATTRSRFRIQWYGPNASGVQAQVGSTISVIGTDYRTTPAASQTVQDLSTTEVAPAGADRVLIQPFVEYSTTQNNAGTPFFSHPRIFRQAQLGVGVTLENGTTLATNALLQTSLGTAAAFTGQGALATLGQVNLGASGRVYRDDGTTRLTDALAVTSLGVAASIASQGALATLNALNSSGQIGAGIVVYTALSSTAVRLGTNITRADGSTSLTDALAVTSLGTAAAITGQGGLATLGYVTFASNIRRQDGSTLATDSDYLTQVGTAAAIALQGALATLNTVGTTTIDAGSITTGAVEENDTAQAVDENWTALADVSIAVPSSATLVKLDWSFFIASSGEAEDDLLVRIKRDSTVIYETTAARVPPTFDFETTETGPLSWQGYAVGQFSGFDTDAPSAGTYTYTLEAKSAYSTTVSWSLEKRRLFALLFKR